MMRAVKICSLEEDMRRSMAELLNELERHGVRLLPGGRLQVPGNVPAPLLMRAHRNRRALSAALAPPRG